MWWKVYFWILLILTILSLVFTINEIARFSLADWRSVLESIIIVIGSYSFVFNKKMLTVKNWNIIFWYLVIFWSLDVIHSLGLSFGPAELLFKSGLLDGGAIIISILVGLPMLYAIHKLRSSKN